MQILYSMLWLCPPLSVFLVSMKASKTKMLPVTHTVMEEEMDTKGPSKSYMEGPGKGTSRLQIQSSPPNVPQ